jgi:hypothetical protein
MALGIEVVRRVMSCGLALGLLAAAAGPVHAQRISFEKRFFTEQVLRSHSQPVIPIYEGWYRNADGTYEICFGYFNLNMDEALDIPRGERNVLEPSQYDGHQPTHFTQVPGMSPSSPFRSRFRRYWCAFTVRVPADFSQDDQVWWTLQREDGEALRTPGTINPAYILDEPRSGGMGELAPILRFTENGEGFQGRHGSIGPVVRARVGQPVSLSVFIEHPFEEEMWAGWVKYQGPGQVTFSQPEQEVAISGQRGVATTSATFSEPGEYQVLFQSLDQTANFEFHCCWTNAYLRINVTN